MSLPLPFVTSVSGVSFRPEAVALVRPGMVAHVRREPDSPYDPNACAVEVNGQVVGHIPAAVAARLVSRAEDAWVGEIVEKIGTGDKTGLRVRVSGGLVPGPRDGSAGEPVIDRGIAPAVAVVDSLSSNEAPEGSSELVTDVAGPEVRTRSRRLVGYFVEKDDTHVTVRNDQGSLVRYPVELVVVMSA